VDCVLEVLPLRRLSLGEPELPMDILGRLLEDTDVITVTYSDGHQPASSGDFKVTSVWHEKIVNSRKGQWTQKMEPGSLAHDLNRHGCTGN
jgi:hypothetical protein